MEDATRVRTCAAEPALSFRSKRDLDLIARAKAVVLVEPTFSAPDAVPKPGLYKRKVDHDV